MWWVEKPLAIILADGDGRWVNLCCDYVTFSNVFLFHLITQNQNKLTVVFGGCADHTCVCVIDDYVSALSMPASFSKSTHQSRKKTAFVSM